MSTKFKCKIDLKCTVQIVEGCCCCQLKKVSLVLCFFMLMFQIIGLLWFMFISPISDPATEQSIFVRISRISFHVIGFLLWILMLIGILTENKKLLLLWILCFGLLLAIIFLLTVYFLPLCIYVLVYDKKNNSNEKPVEFLGALLLFCIFGFYCYTVMGSYYYRLDNPDNPDGIDV